MSDETGGFAVVNRNDFATAFQRIVDDNSSYYVMGYYSTNDRRDGRFRSIEVRVKDRPGLAVRARKGYVAPRGRAPETKTAAAKDAPSAELKEALESPLPLPALPLAIDRGGVQGPGAEGLGRDLDLRSRRLAAVRRKGRDVQERSRSGRHRHRRQGQGLQHRSQHRRT